MHAAYPACLWLFIYEWHDQLKHHKCVDFLSTMVRDISHKMRAILVDWLVEVTEEYALNQQTLFITVNLVDAYLRRSDLPRKSLQLLGVACMLIASKYEEIHPPSAEDFSYITDYTYSTMQVSTFLQWMHYNLYHLEPVPISYFPDQVVAMEERVLDVLSFDISIVTSWEFRRRFILAIEQDRQVLSLASVCLCHFICVVSSVCLIIMLCSQYFLEISLQYPVSVLYKPSILAAAAISLANITLNQPRWVCLYALSFCVCIAGVLTSLELFADDISCP